MDTALSCDGDLSRRSRVSQNDATVIVCKVQHSQAILGRVQILRPCMCMSPNTQQHGGPVIGTQKVIRVNFHAIPRASGASDIAARSARARELLLQARPDSVDVRRDVDTLLQRVHKAVAVVSRCETQIIIPFTRNI